MYQNVPFALKLIVQRRKYDGRKIRRLCAHLREDCIQFYLLIYTWNTKFFEDLLFSHCYLQLLYFTAAFLISLYSVFFYLLLKLTKFLPLEVLESRFLKFIFNLFNCKCGSLNFRTAVGGQCTTNNPTVSNCIASPEYGWCINREFQEMFRRRLVNMWNLFSLILLAPSS